MEEQNKKSMSISAKSFISALIVIFILMIAAYVLTFLIPGGQYVRTDDGSGNMIITAESAFSYIDGGIPFWKWLLSPFLVLGAPGSALVLAVIAFLLVIGGVFEGLTQCGLMQYMLDRIAHKYGAKRYVFLAVLMFFFMAMGALIGSFEECIPLVPIVVALAVSMGWDKLTGLGMSLLAVSCGFASGVCNPFTVGVAQSLAGLPMFSGIWLRALGFVLIYALLWSFVRSHAKKVEKPIPSEVTDSFTPDEKLEKGLKTFSIIIAVGLVTVLSSGFITFLQDFTLYIVALMFLVAGISAPLVTGMSGKTCSLMWIHAQLGSCRTGDGCGNSRLGEAGESADDTGDQRAGSSDTGSAAQLGADFHNLLDDDIEEAGSLHDTDEHENTGHIGDDGIQTAVDQLLNGNIGLTCQRKAGSYCSQKRACNSREVNRCATRDHKKQGQDHDSLSE